MMAAVYNLLARKFFWGFLRHFLSDRQYAKWRYRIELNQPLNLENPDRFTEKIQHLKLYNRNPLRKKIADRTKVRTYVAKQAGQEYLIPLVGVYDKMTPKIWEDLPQQFVLKANHGCEMLKIVCDKEVANYEDIYLQTEQWKQFNYAKLGREWVYEDLPRTIVAEELLLDSSQSIPKDYKFLCFNGRVKLIQIDFNRFGEQKRNLYDRKFKQLDATLLYPPYQGNVEKPGNLSAAIKVAEKLSPELNFVRVDLYLPDGNIYFGELTNFPGSGFVPFQPEKFEYKMGSYLKLAD